jgi:hypothetical protein
MKSAASTESLRTWQRRSERTRHVSQRECLALCDLTDCLLQACDDFTHRAYERAMRPEADHKDLVSRTQTMFGAVRSHFAKAAHP